MSSKTRTRKTLPPARPPRPAPPRPCGRCPTRRPPRRCARTPKTSCGRRCTPTRTAPPLTYPAWRRSGSPPPRRSWSSGQATAASPAPLESPRAAVVPPTWWAITEGDAALVDAAPVDQDDAPADDARRDGQRRGRQGTVGIGRVARDGRGLPARPPWPRVRSDHDRQGAGREIPGCGEQRAGQARRGRRRRQDAGQAEAFRARPGGSGGCPSTDDLIGPVPECGCVPTVTPTLLAN